MRAVAEEIVEQQDQATPEEAPQKKGRGLFGIIKAVAFISIIVVVQVVGASMLVPSAKDTEKLAPELVAASSGKAAGEHEENAKGSIEEAGKEQELHEVELGSYNVTRFNPGTNTTL